MGVDGIIMASEAAENPQPASEWEMAVTTTEGRVFHRRAGPIPVVRSIAGSNSRPNEQFAPAAVSGIDDERNRVGADVAVPPAGRPALLAISRPFFRGYVAKIGGRALTVESDRGLIPIVEVPPGATGRLSLVYRPWWLVWGAGVSFCCAAIVAVGLLLARRDENRNPRTEFAG
jgi:hypothetical protein